MGWSIILCWDGLLPAVVALSPVCARYVLGPHHFGTLLLAVVVPVVASLTRAAAGPVHLKHAGPPSVIRQVAFAAAVALLFAIELTSSISQISGPLPGSVWLIIGLAYLVYFALIVLALRAFPLRSLVSERDCGI